MEGELSREHTALRNASLEQRLRQLGLTPVKVAPKAAPEFDWEEHVSENYSGRKFWHNAKTGASVWEKPAEYDAERAAAAAAQDEEETPEALQQRQKDALTRQLLNCKQEVMGNARLTSSWAKNQLDTLGVYVAVC